MPEFLDLGGAAMPNLAGIKYTDGDLFEYQQCRAVDDGRFDMLWGVDEILLGVLASGKALMSMHGVDCGSPRPPVASLDPEKRDSLLRDVASLNIIEPGPDLPVAASA